MGFLGKLRGSQSGRSATVVMLNGGGLVRPVGESHYQEAFAKICGPKTEDGFMQPVTVTLVAEPDNPYDSKAVAVYVEGKKVAHLSKAGAAGYQPVILGLVRKGASVQCRGVIKGGWLRPGSEGSFGIVLALSDPKRCLPPSPTLEWADRDDDDQRVEWFRIFFPPTGRWACDRCGNRWSDSTPQPPGWALLKEGPHVCPDCGSYAATHPVA